MSDIKTGVTLRSVVNAISSTVDLVNDNLTRHHQRVAFISHTIGEQMKISRERAYDLILAAAMHDIGTLSHDGESSELHNVLDQDVESHAETGYILLNKFKPLERVANIIKYHHHQWEDGKGHVAGGKIVPYEGHIIHLADFVDMLINKDVYILHQKKAILETVRSQSGTMFAPTVVNAFLEAFSNDYNWLHLDHLRLDEVIKKEFPEYVRYLTLDELIQFTKIISYLIDFRSPYTASHSSGVAAVAMSLGMLSGMDSYDCSMLQIAGFLHDMGKLSIHTCILDKEAGLSQGEFDIMRSHSYHTYRILGKIKGLETVTMWASHHHERMDGSGYPFGLKGEDISTGARIVAVADVFSALTEERPYRSGMNTDDAAELMKKMARDNKLDPGIVGLLLKNLKQVHVIRARSQEKALQEYLKINKNVRIGRNGLSV
jgi:HD-GYP domain-containing protein (c-di-GMP phosphodiesterase class II)